LRLLPVALARVSCGHTNNGSGCHAPAGSPTYATCNCADRRAANRPPRARTWLRARWRRLIRHLHSKGNRSDTRRLLRPSLAFDDVL
jgi:hypothetical protein